MILLIEDDLVTCRIMSVLLNRQRQRHIVVHDGAGALDVMAKHPVDLIIVDLGLPDMDGVELVEQILLRPYLQDIPVMFCTGQADRATVERALGLGAVDFVKKPINVDAFAGRIERALKRAPARWESWREILKRLRVDSRTFQPLLTLSRDHLVELIETLARLTEAAVAIDAPRRKELSASVLCVRSAALNVGAIRTVQVIDFLWTGRAMPDDIAELHAALVIELNAFEQALQSRVSRLAAADS